MQDRNGLPPAFKRLAWSNLLAQSAEQVGLATAPLLAVFLLCANTSETALLQTVQSLPFLLLAIPAGLLADRCSRRGVLAVAECLRAFSFGLILLLLARGNLGMAGLAILGFVGATATVAYNVTAPGMVPLLVERSTLAAANSRLELARSIAFTAGPSVAGLFFNALGASFAYSLALILSLAAVNFLRTLPSNAATSRKRNILGELSEGLVFTFGNALLRPVVFTAIFFNMSWFLLQAAYVPYAAEKLGLTAFEVGGTLAVYGVGMVSGALASPWIGRRVRFGTLVVLGPVGGLLGALVMAATLLAPAPPLAWISFFFFGAGPILWTISTATLRQALTPPELIGRVSAVVMTLTFGARPLGAAIAAGLGAAYGASACILAAVAGFVLQLAIILGSKVPKLITLPHGTGDQPSTHPKATMQPE